MGEGKLKDKAGNCVFCGQQIMVKAEEDATASDLNWLATDACNCEAARDWQFRRDQKALCEMKIKECCANETVRDVLIDNIENIQNQAFRDIQIITEDGVLFQIKRTATAKLKIKCKTILMKEAEA